MTGPAPTLVHTERPHRDETTPVIKTALVRVSRDASRYARTGPKRFEDALHRAMDGLLDELQHRGEL